MSAGDYRFSPHPNRAAAINWHEWGDEPFQLAQKEQKPVLLSISAVWCHWCHVLDETGFSDEEVISLINRSFIPVRVDSDRRPDINVRYNNGGWPTIAFLNPDAEAIAGTTYMPPAELLNLLTEVSRLYEQNAVEIAGAIEEVRQQRAERLKPSPGELSHDIAADALKEAAGQYDKEEGGFGRQAKFPNTAVLSLIRTTLAGHDDSALLEILTKTLDTMAAGGIHDTIEGGFFRYAMQPDWSEPHYEKMLEDNAALLSVYAGAFQLTGDGRYEQAARGIQRYLEKTLLNPGSGAFGGSQDADEAYYRLPAAERGKTPPPAVDRTVYCGWNAQAAAALLASYQTFGDAAFRSQALGALDFIWESMWENGSGPYHYHDGSPHLPGMLADAAPLLGACLDAYESGAGDLWLDRALKVAAWMLKSLRDEELQEDGTSAFYDCAIAPGDRGLAAERVKPLVENSLAASGLIRLAQVTCRPGFGDAAAGALRHFAGNSGQYGLFGAEYALAVERLLDTPVRVTISGPPEDGSTQEMIRAAHRARVPFRSLEILDPEVHGEELKESGYGYEGKPVAYVCIGSSCQPPVSDAGDLPGRLESGRSKASS